MSKKCICFLRVSTTQQDLQVQEDRVKAVAIADGYSEDEISIVKGKESAIKLKEEERQTLNEMKQIIADNPSIESVYVFAIDRLARRVSVIMSVKDYLTERSINLVFLNPHKMGTLRRDDKTNLLVEDELTSLLLMLLSYGAEMEMKVKKARWKEAKQAMREQGKLAEGITRIGYTTDEHSKIIPNEDEAKHIRYIFQEYADGKQSLRQLYDYLVSVGIKSPKPMHSCASMIRDMISDLRYSGREREGILVRYPPIVTEELQDRAIKMLVKNRTSPKKNSKNIYYCKGIIRNTSDGKVMIARASTFTYLSQNQQKSMNINVADFIAWKQATGLYAYKTIQDSIRKESDNKEAIKETKEKIENIQSLLDEIRNRQSIAFRLLVTGKVAQDIYDENMKEIDADERKWEKEIARLNGELTQYETQMFDDDENVTIKTDDIDSSITDDATRKKIIDSLIESVNCTFTNDKDNSVIIEVVPKPRYKRGNFLTPIFKYYQRGGKYTVLVTLHHDDGTEQVEDLSQMVVKRFKQRNRGDRHKNRGNKQNKDNMKPNQDELELRAAEEPME